MDIGQIIQFAIEYKWTIAVLVPIILVIIIVKIRG